MMSNWAAICRLTRTKKLLATFCGLWWQLPTHSCRVFATYSGALTELLLASAKSTLIFPTHKNTRGPQFSTRSYEKPDLQTMPCGTGFSLCSCDVLDRTWPSLPDLSPKFLPPSTH